MHLFQAVTVLPLRLSIPSRTLEFVPHARLMCSSWSVIPLHLHCLFCSVSSTPTTSDSFIVRVVGVEPTILTTIGIRLLSVAQYNRVVRSYL